MYRALFVFLIFMSPCSELYSADDITSLLGGEQDSVATKETVSGAEMVKARKDTAKKAIEKFEPVAKVVEEMIENARSASSSSKVIAGCSKHLMLTLSLGEWWSGDLKVKSSGIPDGVSLYSDSDFLDNDRNATLSYQRIYSSGCIGGQYSFDISLLDKNHLSADTTNIIKTSFNVSDGASSCSISVDTDGLTYGSCR